MEPTFTQLVFGELPVYPHWAALFVFFSIGASLYQYRRVTKAIEENSHTPNKFDPWHYMKDLRNHLQFLAMLACGFIVIRFGAEWIGIEAVSNNITALCGAALALGSGGQLLITLVLNGLEIIFSKLETMLRK